MELLATAWQFIAHLDDQLGLLLQQYGVWIYLILFLIVFCETGLVVTPFLPGDSLLFASGALWASADMPVEVWERGVGVMLTGVFLCLKFEIPAILAQGGGAIVNTSSGAGLIGFPGMADYVSSKHGVLGLTKTAALENAQTGLRINAICPGTARTKMVEDWIGGDDAAEQQVRDLHPIGRIAAPEEIANAVLWLCSDEASFVMGHAMVVDGGYSIQ